jgi:hypothetical protein
MSLVPRGRAALDGRVKPAHGEGGILFQTML